MVRRFFSLIISDMRTGRANLNFKIFKVCFKFGHFHRKPNLIKYFFFIKKIYNNNQLDVSVT